MADRGGVKIRPGDIDSLIQIYENAYTNIVKSLVDSTKFGKIQKIRTMMAIRTELERMGVDVDKWVQDTIPQYYLDGANVAVQDLRALGVDTSAVGIAVVNKQAIAALTDETALSFAEGITALGRDGQRILNDAIKQQLNFIVADGKLTGAARKTISANIEAKLKENGLTSLTDKAGHQWSFDVYARMLARTKAVEARNQGLANRMLASGYDLVQISNHNSKHPACARWEGKIVSITGKTPAGTQLPGGYEVAGSMDEAKADGLFHPNCEHSANVFHANLAAVTHAYDNPYNVLDADGRNAADLAFANRNRSAAAIARRPDLRR